MQRIWTTACLSSNNVLIIWLLRKSHNKAGGNDSVFRDAKNHNLKIVLGRFLLMSKSFCTRNLLFWVNTQSEVLKQCFKTKSQCNGKAQSQCFLKNNDITVVLALFIFIDSIYLKAKLFDVKKAKQTTIKSRTYSWRALDVLLENLKKMLRQVYHV